MDYRPDSNLFYNTESTCGQQVRKVSSELVKLAGRIATWENHRVFNIRCMQNHILPRSITVKPLVPTAAARKKAETTSRYFLKQRLHLTNRTLAQHRETSQRLHQQLQTTLPSYLWIELEKKLREVYVTQSNKVKQRQTRKFQTLINLQKTGNKFPSTIKNEGSALPQQVVDLSSRGLSINERKLLEKGLSYSLKRTKLDAEEVIPAVESTMFGMQTQKAEELRLKIVQIIKSQTIDKYNLDKDERQAFNSLKLDDNILIMKADKGGATVVLDKEDYSAKLEQHIGEGPYTEIKNKTVDQLMNKNKDDVIQYLKQIKERIEHSKWCKLYPKSTHPPRLYGLPKLHKQNIPIRPIVDSMGAPSHELARYLASILKPLTGKTSSFIKKLH